MSASAGSEREGKAPTVRVFVIIERDGRILVGKRKSGVAQGTWGTPGGKLDLGESFEECARREVREETALSLGELRLLGVLNDPMPEHGDHQVTIWMHAALPSGEPENPAPDETECWEWHGISALPTPVFPPLAHLVREAGGASNTSTQPFATGWRR